MPLPYWLSSRAVASHFVLLRLQDNHFWRPLQESPGASSCQYLGCRLVDQASAALRLKSVAWFHSYRFVIQLHYCFGIVALQVVCPAGAGQAFTRLFSWQNAGSVEAALPFALLLYPVSQFFPAYEKGCYQMAFTATFHARKIASAWTLPIAAACLASAHWRMRLIFNVNEKGHVDVKATCRIGRQLICMNLSRRLREKRAGTCRCWCRFPIFRRERAPSVTGAFDSNIAELNTPTVIRAVNPIKVNQQEAVVENIIATEDVSMA